MKQAEIEVGGEYLTRISGALVRVRVVAQVIRGSRFAGSLHSQGPQLKRFVVARVDTGATLPKVRPASALHKPALDPFEASLRRELKADPTRKPELQAQWIVYRFLKAIGCPTNPN